MLPSGFCGRFAAAVVLTAGAVGAWAQIQPSPDRGTWAEAQFIPQDRQLASLLERARQQLSGLEADQRRGLETLQRIIDNADDYFTDRKLGGSLRGSVEALLAELPDDGRRLYEQMYGGEARALLEAASRADNARVADVIRRFLFTQAGQEAALTRAAIEMDRGGFLTAARQFERLWKLHQRTLPPGAETWERAVTAFWKAGLPHQSEELFLQAVGDAEQPPSWRGQALPKFATRGEAVTWLHKRLGAAGPTQEMPARNWLVPGGGSARNASAEESSPVFDNAWRTPLLGSEMHDSTRFGDLQVAVESVSAAADNEQQWRTCAVAEPLVVGDTVLFSTYERIKAVDARTGEFRWQAADTDPVFEYLAQGSVGKFGVPPSMGPSLLESFVAQRAWLDATSASLSSDRQRVFQVFDSGLITSPQSYNLAESGPHPLNLPSYNRLRAYDLETEGKLLWEVGGPPGRVSLPMAGTFFLGAPLPVDDSLYVLGEDRGQVRLLVLDPGTGDLQWSTALLNTMVDINGDLERRLAGLSPAYAGGMLICPTGGGLLVAVDITQRSLLWAYVYDEPKSTRPSDIFGGRLQQFNDPGEGTPSIETLLATPRWSGPSTVIAGEFVLHTPPSHSMLHCVRLLDGRRQWTRPRQRLMSLAGVYRDAVILVGERHVEAVQLATGQTIWELPLPPPSGRSEREGPLLRLPLRGGDLVTIDLDTGRLLARSQARSGAELGTLVAAGGRLFSQTATELRGFRSLSELQEQITADLAVDPHDPAVLAVRGELRLHAGQTEEALADLRASFEAVPDDRVQGLIVGTLLERLRENFAAHRGTVPELDRLTTDPEQRIQLLRIIALGLETEGELVGAYDRYLQLLAQEELAGSLEHVSDGHTVRLDRWVQGKLQRLYAQSAPEMRSELDARAAACVAAAVTEQDVGRLERAASAFRTHAAGKTAFEAWADRIDPLHDPLRAEALGLRQRREGTLQQRAAAVARLVQLYADQGRGELVDALLRELGDGYAETIVQDGKPGSEFAAALRETPAIRAALSDVVHWPTASIEVGTQQEGAPQQQRTIPLRVVGPTDPLFASSSIHSDTRGEFTAFDGMGRFDWSEQVPSHLGFGFPESHYVERNGHRALLFLGNQFRLIDMLRFGQPPRVILDDDLAEGARRDRLGRPMTRIQIGRMGLRTVWRSEDGLSGYMGNTGPLRDDLFCYQQGTTLFGVDPFSGEELWHLDDIPHGCEILADEQYVLLVPPDPRHDHQEVRIFLAADGTSMGTRRLPSEIVSLRQGADWGRMFLTKSLHAGTPDVTLAMYDPVSGENRWERSIPQYLTWAPLDGYDLVVLSESGQLQLLDAETGETKFEAQTEITADVKSVTVVGHPDEWFLFTERSPGEEQQTRLTLPSSRMEFHAVNGIAYAFDRRRQERLWSRKLLSLLVDPNLPGRWPLLVLSSEAWVVPGDGRGRTANRFQNLLLLNKRTGDVLFEGDGTGRWQGTTWSLSPDAPQLRLSFNGTGLAVSFGDDATGQITEDASSPDDGTPSESAAPSQRRVPAPPLPSFSDDVEK